MKCTGCGAVGGERTAYPNRDWLAKHWNTRAEPERQTVTDAEAVEALAQATWGMQFCEGPRPSDFPETGKRLHEELAAQGYALVKGVK